MADPGWYSRGDEEEDVQDVRIAKLEARIHELEEHIKHHCNEYCYYA